MLIHKDLHYRRRKDLETSVWVQLSHPGRKPLLIQALYRQFQQLGRKGSITPASQTARWHKIINKWELANAEDKEIITVGDLNLNCLRWDLQPSQRNSYDRYKKTMIDEPKSKILDKGHKILINIETLYEGESNIITQNIEQIINDSLQTMSPIKIIQVKHKNKTQLSENVRFKMVERDQAYLKSKQTRNPEDIREYKNFKNLVNNQIAKEKFDRKVKSFQEEDKTLGDKWKLIKKESGQSKYTAPQMIVEGKSIQTTHSHMAASLNRQYLQKVRKIYTEIEST